MLNTVTDNFKDWQLLATISDALVATDASTAETTTHEEHPCSRRPHTGVSPRIIA